MSVWFAYHTLSWTEEMCPFQKQRFVIYFISQDPWFHHILTQSGVITELSPSNVMHIIT